MSKNKRKNPAINSNADEEPNAAGNLSKEGNARRRFLEDLGKWSAALAVSGLGAETALQVLSERSVLASAVAAGSVPNEIPPPPVPTGSIYWVATDGDDSNAGTEAQPFATVQKAHDSLSPGDGIYVKPGKYSVRRFDWTKTDTILRGAPDTTREQVILNAGGSGWGSVLRFHSDRVNSGEPALENIQLYGVTVQGGDAGGGWINEGIIIRGYVRNFKAINCVVRHCHNRGLYFTTPTEGQGFDPSDFPHNNEVAHCEFYSIGKDTAAGDISLGGRTGYVHIHHNELHGDVDGIVTVDSYIGSLIEYNNIYDHFGPDGDPSTGSSSEDGIDLKLIRYDNPLLPAGHRTVIRYNRIYGHPKQTGITVQMGTVRTTIYKNDIYNNRNGIWARPSEPDGTRCCTADIIIEDNDIHDNYYRGVFIRTESSALKQIEDVQIINNRIYDNGNDAGPNPTPSTRPAGLAATTGDRTILTGNIISNNGRLGAGNPQLELSGLKGVSSDNNTFFLPSRSDHVARIGDNLYDFSEWQSASGQDRNSALVRDTYTPPVSPHSPTSIKVVGVGGQRKPT